MTIGPEPMMRIVCISVRFGIKYLKGEIFNNSCKHEQLRGYLINSFYYNYLPYLHFK